MYGACDPQDQPITLVAGRVDTGKHVFYTAAWARPWRMQGWGAIADYGPDEHRLMKRCQVVATKIFAPEFRQRVALESVLA